MYQADNVINEGWWRKSTHSFHMNVGISTLAQCLSHTSRSGIGKHGNTSMLLSLPWSLQTYRCLCISALKAMPSLQLVVKLWMLTFGYLPKTEHKTKQQNYQIQVYAFAKCLKNKQKTKKPCVHCKLKVIYQQGQLSLSICPLKISLLWNKNKTVVCLYICLLIKFHERCELCSKPKTLFLLKWPLSWCP